MKAIWNGQVIAESDQIVTVEGNAYFPPESVDPSYIIPSETTSSCPWKGKANYYSLVVAGKENTDAAWYYSNPKEAAKEIEGHVAFWKGVEVLD